MTGYTASHVRGNNYATFAYDASTGRTEWSARYDGQQNGGDDDPAGIAVSPDGSKVVVTGRSYDATSGGTDFATVAYKG